MKILNSAGTDQFGSEQKPLLIVISGLPGAGKTTSAAALSDEFTRAGVKHGTIDLDQLCQLSPEDGTDGSELMFENLAAVWPNYVRRGARALIVARVVDASWQVDRYKVAVPGCHLVIARVTAPLEELDKRLEAREYGEWVPKLQGIARRLSEAVENGGHESFVVENTGKTPQQLGVEIFDALISQGDLNPQILRGPSPRPRGTRQSE